MTECIVIGAIQATRPNIKVGQEQNRTTERLQTSKKYNNGGHYSISQIELRDAYANRLC